MRAYDMLSRGCDIAISSRLPTSQVSGCEEMVTNREAYEWMTCERRLEVVPGATHLFEEPGALGEVSRLAAEWFVRYLPAGD